MKNPASTFARKVWSEQPTPNGYVFLSWKDRAGKWHDKPFQLLNGKPQKFRIPNNGEDVYFCPYVFKKPRRLARYAYPSPYLHADLDEVDPAYLDLAPTTAWETSPGRFQCLWKLYTPLSPKLHRQINQRLTYHTESDRGGWSITKVLRLPGTTSLKREEPFEVNLLWQDQQYYKAKTVYKLIKNVEVKAGSSTSPSDLELPDITAQAIMHNHKSRIPKRALQLLKTKRAAIGERSERLWELECLLITAGLSPEETVILVRDTVWNKYAGTRRELPQLWAEVQKVAEDRILPDQRERRLIKLDEFVATDIPVKLWAVQDIWSESAHGVIAGEPKTYKSLIATDLAVSVASGTKFLGEFEVPVTGPVIIIQEENTAAMMKDRLEKITHARALDERIEVDKGRRTVQITSAQDLPIHLMNNGGFNLTDDSDLAFLETEIKRIKPALVVLDPLYLMSPGVDENSAHAMTPILRELLRLKQTYDVGILLVHHFNKPRDGDDRHPGYRISGTGAFYRWFESALYLEKGDQPSTLVITPEHRAAPPSGHIHVEVDMGDMGELAYHLDVDIRRTASSSMRRLLLDLISDHPLTVQDASEALQCTPERVRKLVERMEQLDFAKGKADGSPGRPSKMIVLVKAPQGGR